MGKSAQKAVVIDEDVMRFLTQIRSGEGVAESEQRILFQYKVQLATMSKDKGTSAASDPWNLSGQSSRQTKQKPPPERARQQNDEETHEP